MQYVALLRGVNVGTSKRIDMKTLKKLFESIGYTEVLTYINSGNILFCADETHDKVEEAIQEILFKNLGEGIKVVLKTKEQMREIAKQYPKSGRMMKSKKPMLLTYLKA